MKPPTLLEQSSVRAVRETEIARTNVAGLSLVGQACATQPITTACVSTGQSGDALTRKDIRDGTQQ
jgi:hypothetical protein